MATGSGGDNVPFWRIVVVCRTKSWRIETPPSDGCRWSEELGDGTFRHSPPLMKETTERWQNLAGARKQGRWLGSPIVLVWRLDPTLDPQEECLCLKSRRHLSERFLEVPKKTYISQFHTVSHIQFDTYFVAGLSIYRSRRGEGKEEDKHKKKITKLGSQVASKTGRRCKISMVEYGWFIVFIFVFL